MSNAAKFCVFCKESKDNVNLFTVPNLETCKDILKCRKYYKLKFSDVELPETANATHGYHRACRNSFVALKQKHKHIPDDEARPSSRQNVAETAAPAAANSGNNGERTSTPENGSEQESELAPKNSQKQVENRRENQGEKKQAEEGGTENENVSTLETDAGDTMAQEMCPEEEPSGSEITDKGGKENVCIICKKSRVTVNKKIVPLVTSTDQALLEQLDEAAAFVGDEETRQNILCCCNQKIFMYHKRCKASILNRKEQMQRELQQKGNDWHKIRLFNKNAFEEICAFVKEKVVKNKMFCYLDSLRKLYNDSIATQIHESNAQLNFTDIESNKLEIKLLKELKTDIEIGHLSKKKIVQPRNTIIPDNFCPEALDKMDLLQRAAITLREEIFSITKRELPDALNATEIARGECSIPDCLQIFYDTLLSGANLRRRSGEKCKRLSSSFAQDAIFGVTNGKVKPAKHMQLGIALKSLTSSRKIIDIMNRYGHSCSYNVVEEIETEAVISSLETAQVCPEDVIKSPYLCTGLAFNNFDRFVDSLTGKETLHDTVGIIYQDIRETSSQNESDEEFTPLAERDCSKRRKRRRTCDPVTPELEEYSKRPRFNEELLPLDALNRYSVSNFDISQWQKMYNLWTLSHIAKLPKTPMWTGFQTLLFDDYSNMQKVSYMTTINASPTNKSVIIETMKQALQVAEECGQAYIQVTYDLAIAKIALQIQSLERPRFDRLFIHFGAFHIDLAYFKAVGKFIENCGITNIMIDSGIIAGGSLSGFMSGKHYNRCKRMHTLLTLVLQILHWQQFLKTCNIDVSEGSEIYRALSQIRDSTSSVKNVLENRRVRLLLGKYENYVDETMNGEHGCTPQYFMTYLKLMEYHFTLQTSIRRRNYDMYLYILPFLTNLFFAFNQQNYARWMTRYQDNFLKVTQTHPGLEEEMRANGIGVRRTPKPHSTQPIDLILEETINLDAANSMTGISHITNSIAARQRWCKSHSFRTSVISNMMQDLSLRRKQDVSGDLKESRIKKSHSQIEKLLFAIEENVNPFDPEVPKNSLFNISSGEAVSDSIYKSLVDVEKTGNALREKFIEECSSDETRFEKPIKKAKVLTFVDAQPKKKMNIGGKVQEVKMQRDLFGRLLGVAVDQKLNLDEVFQYPLTPMPLSMCHVDGSIHKTDKSVLLKSLESQITSNEPKNIDLVVIDGFFVLHTIKEIPIQYGKIASKCLSVFLNHKSKEIAVIFDSYFSPSIKDNEHLLRDNTEERSFRISGPEQKRCTDFTKDLKNINFKKALIDFFIQEWSKNEYASNFKSKVLYVTADVCHKFEVVEEKIVSTIVDELSCENHEEADTKIVNHICNSSEDFNVMIRCSDTDILVIMLANMDHVKNGTTVWMNVGVANSQRYIDVTKLYSHLGPDFCKSLPGFHALTGCDFNPSFYRKGKKRPLGILQKSKEFQAALAKLGESDDGTIDDSTFTTVENFVCQIYNVKGVTSVNEARTSIFYKNFKVDDVAEKFMRKATNFDGATIPPCKSELSEQILRTKYIANLWCNAHRKNPTDFFPTNYGWVEKSGKYTFSWFKGEQVPRFVKSIVIQPENVESEDVENVDETDDFENFEEDVTFSDSDVYSD